MTPGLEADILLVLEYVSRGRGYVDVERYPDAAARRALGAIGDAPEGSAFREPRNTDPSDRVVQTPL